MSIYQCLRRDDHYTPPLMRVMHEAATQREAITWLEENGGGIYRNLLHQFECGVAPVKPVPNCDRSACGGFSPGECDHPVCAAKKETTMSTVLLTSGTVGTTSTEAAVGDTVTVTLHDENGNNITETGTVEEVLE